MNDQPDVLEPGSLGRLAVLAGEIRGLRGEVAVLLGEVGRLSGAGERIVEQQRIHANVLAELRGGQDDMTNMLANSIEGLHAICSLLTTPPPDAGADPDPISQDHEIGSGSPNGVGRPSESEPDSGASAEPSSTKEEHPPEGI